MQTQKVQITLTPEEAAALSFKGKTLGYNVTKYIKFIITKEAFETVEAYPEYKMGPGLEEKTKAALKEFKNGKTRKLESIDELDSL